MVSLEPLEGKEREEEGGGRDKLSEEEGEEGGLGPPLNVFFLRPSFSLFLLSFLCCFLLSLFSLDDFGMEGVGEPHMMTGGNEK